MMKYEITVCFEQEAYKKINTIAFIVKTFLGGKAWHDILRHCVVLYLPDEKSYNEIKKMVDHENKKSYSQMMFKIAELEIKEKRRIKKDHKIWFIKFIIYWAVAIMIGYLYIKVGA